VRCRRTKEKKKEDGNSCHAAVRENFGKLLTKLLLNSKCYEHLEKFEALYKTLEDKGVKLPNTSVLVRKLMLYKIDSDSTLGVEGVELSAQRRFFGSTLWNQFEKQRAVTLLGRAKNEEHGEKRDRLLKLWDAVPKDAMCPETKAEVDMARSLFLSTLPLPSRVSFALGDEARVTFAAGWKADFDFSTLKYFRTTPSTWDGLTVAGFTETYNFILINDMKDLVTNAVMKTILDYGVSLAAHTAEKTWWGEFLKLTVAARLGLLMSWYGTETPEFDEKLVDAESIDKVERETAKLLLHTKGDRPWMTAFKQRSRELKEAKAKSSQAASASDGKKAPPAAAEQEGEADNTTLDEEGTAVASAGAAASSAEAKKPGAKEAKAAKADAHDPKYVAPCEVGDIVLVKARQRPQYNGFKGKVVGLLTGDVKLEMLEGPTVGTKDAHTKTKFLQVEKLPSPDEKPEPEKEGKKEKKSKVYQTLNTLLGEAEEEESS